MCSSGVEGESRRVSGAPLVDSDLLGLQQSTQLLAGRSLSPERQVRFVSRWYLRLFIGQFVYFADQEQLESQQKHPHHLGFDYKPQSSAISW